ncbi:MAG: AarF/ABC1/UbiB kinase family protein [Planctomyces sp.]|nr:AarF/ABC1/UbiB kinase family protein [Planctomyces sp.]
MDTHPLRFFRSLGRSRQIATVLLNHGFGDLMDRVGLRRYLRWGTRLFRRQRGTECTYTTWQRIRLALEDLGPTYIKFGQVISTRPDILPAQLIEELAQLQEGVPSFDSDLAVRLVEQELGAPVSQLFAEFEREPVAAGSLAQVHRAVHRDGTTLAVKVRRPDVIAGVERDLTLMADLAELAERHLPETRPFDPIGLVSQFARTIRREMNFRREARTLQEFRRAFEGDATLYVPQVYEDLSSEGVLTMEFVCGCRADDRLAIARLGVPPTAVATNGAHIFMKMAFDVGMFHGDPHPGNIRIRPDGTVALLDYGMVGYLEPAKRDQLVDLFVAVVHNDAARAVEVVQVLGQPQGPIDGAALRTDVADFVACYYGISLEQMHVGRLLSDFVALISRHNLRCPPDLMLLIRAMVTLEGVGRTLHPEFNLAGELAPFVEQIVRRRYDPRRVADRAWTDLCKVVGALHSLPGQLSRALGRIGNDDLRVQLEHRGLDRLITEFDRSSNRVVVGVVTSAILLSTAIVLRGGGSLWINVPAFLLSGFLGVWLIYGILRSGRL